MTSTFEESCVRYSQFLRSNGYPGELIWVNQQDILLTTRRLIYVRLPVSEGNRKVVHDLFNKAMREQSGISFSTVCALDAATCCRAWVPADEEERQRAMCPKDLKLSVAAASSRLPGKAVRSALLWRYLRVHYRKLQTAIDDVFWG